MVNLKVLLMPAWGPVNRGMRRAVNEEGAAQEPTGNRGAEKLTNTFFLGGGPYYIKSIIYPNPFLIIKTPM